MPSEKVAEYVALMKRPEGTLEFVGDYPGLLDPSADPGALLNIVTGSAVYLLRRDASMNLEFVHSTPGKGTHKATVDLSPLVDLRAGPKCFVCLTWSPEQTSLYFGAAEPKHLLTGEGAAADFTLQVASDGSIVTLGGPSDNVRGTRIHVHGEQILSPPAIRSWDDTKFAATTLLDGTPSDEYILEVVVGNAVLGMLVTGFETYAKKRFLELEQEGIDPDFATTASVFLSREERDQLDRGEQTEIENEAIRLGVSPIKLLAKRINFQNFRNAKLAFNRCYGLKFGEIRGVSSQQLEALQKLIRYRHRVVHDSPLLGVLNTPEAPPEELHFSNLATAAEATEEFDRFIAALHQATLALR